MLLIFFLSYFFLFVQFLKLFTHCNLTLLNNSCRHASMKKRSVFYSIVRTRGRGAAQTWARPLPPDTPSPRRGSARLPPSPRLGLARKHFKLAAILAKTKRWGARFPSQQSCCLIMEHQVCLAGLALGKSSLAAAHHLATSWGLRALVCASLLSFLRLKLR